jgi:DNA polymerase-3 subunit gamma/tau
MALALYRRYRPDTLQKVIGQDQVTIPLARALDNNKLTNAYLFSGPRGCGKTSTARILARCANCVKGPTSHPCGKCPSCRDLAANGPGSIDVVEIDAASHNSVEDARQIRERATFAPVRDRYKIFILDEAHMVTQQGFNALLKIVEEPPEHVMFIFATTEPDKVISTIRSRTHHYPFRLVPPEIMGPYLTKICQQEKITPEAGVLNLAMRAGGGSVRDTLSVLDQLMVGSENGVIKLSDASELLGFTPTELITGAVDGLINHDGAKLYSIVEKVVVGGYEPRRFVEDLLAHFRDLLVLKLAGQKAISSLGEEAQEEQSSVLTRQSKALDLEKLTRLADMTNDTLAHMAGATSPRMKLELLAAKLLETMDESQQQAPSQPVHLGLRTQPTASSTRPQQSQPQLQSQAQVPQSHASQAHMPQTPESQVKTANSAMNTADSSSDQQPSELELWKKVVAGLPELMQRYVNAQRVPKVDFQRNALGGRHLVLTFDEPLSQHAFALAVSADHQPVPSLVQKAVRQVFGPRASIAPNPVAANGEVVHQMRNLSPQQQMKIKVQIAQRTANMKVSSSSEQSSRSSAQAQSRAQSQAGHAHPGESADKKNTPSTADDQKTDHHADDHAHTSLDEDAPQSAESTVASAAGATDGTDDGFAPASQVDTNPAEKEVTPAALAPSRPSHHAKVVPVPSAQDTSDPWAGQADLSESSEVGDVLGTAVPTGTQSSVSESTDNQASGSQTPVMSSQLSQQPQAQASQTYEEPVEPAQNTPETGSQTSSVEGSAKSPISSVPAVKPRVKAENDVYSKSDSTEDTSGLLSLDQVKEIFDVKAVTTIPAPNGANGSEQQKQEAKIIIPNKKERAKKAEPTSAPTAGQTTSGAKK